MKNDTPTAWDLDIRSFMSDLLRGYFAARPVNTPPGEHLVKQAVLMADEVQKVRGERGWKEGVAFLEGQALVRDAERLAGWYRGAPDMLPPLLPIGTRIHGATEIATSIVELQKMHGEPVYYGEWNGGTGYWPANEIDWEHAATLASSPLPVHPK